LIAIHDLPPRLGPEAAGPQYRSPPRAQSADLLRAPGGELPSRTILPISAPAISSPQMLPGNLPHIAILTHPATGDGERPLCVHNIGAGSRREDILFTYRRTGHYRFGIKARKTSRNPSS
jgi:hypothetical protein